MNTTIIEEKYPFTTVEDSVTERDWAAGTTRQLDAKEFVIKLNPQSGRGNKYIGVYETVRYPPALWKIIDEPIVNSLDHLVRHLGTETPVTCIKIGFDRTGRVRIYNNGPGIEVAVHTIASSKLGREIWVPTFIFGNLFQGSNRKRADDSIIGGTNGIGAKLSNCFSSEFIVETVDSARELYFIQRWRDHKRVEEAPNIISLKSTHGLPAERCIPHTLVSFVPDYVGLFGYKEFDGAVYESLVNIVRTRVIFAAAYARYTIASQPRPQCFEIYFNDERIDVAGVGDIAEILFPGKFIAKTVITPKVQPRGHFKHPWEIAAAIVNTSALEISQLSNVNGVMVRDGKHTKHILNEITGGVEEKITKIFHDKNLKFSSKYVSGNIFLMVNSKIPNPNWTGQRKDTVDINIRKLAGYTLDAKFITALTGKLRDQIIESIFNATPAVKSGKKKQIDYEKYTPARKSGTKRSAECTLICVEGDSAATQVATGVSHNLGFDLYGVISLGGVIMNARKQCTVVETAGSKFINKSRKLMKNVFINLLMGVTGLNSAHKYDPASPSFRAEMSELNYGNITACVDQDLDGKGNILGLLLNVFELFWPNLLRAGYIKWFCTPIIRSYPKSGGKIIEFYSMEEYARWAQLAAAAATKYSIKYYKGLGTHSREETIFMFKQFRQHLYTYYLDDRSHILFEVYFGSDPELRKRQLSVPNAVLGADTAAAQEKTKLISCSDHLENETHLFQKDNLERKLDHVVDGQNQSGRKILDGVIKAYRANNKEMKIAALAGFISEHEKYHHGEASLADSITGRGLVTPGGRQLPIIVPLSNFGSRKRGGKDAASARYIWAKLNKNITRLIFPDCDYWMLPFNFDEGERSEPKYFAPIIPMAILESTELPAHGWKLKTWARDVFKVIENVRRLIRIDDKAPLLRLPPCTYANSAYPWTGEIKTIRGEPFSFGKYTIDGAKNTIKIIELPLRTWTHDYVQALKKRIGAANNRIIAQVVDESDDLRVNIEVKLKPGALGLLETYGGDSYFTDPIEEFFQLRSRMDSHLNLMSDDGSVIMFSGYEDVLYYWFPVRKGFYIQRVHRQNILLRLQICYIKNTIRFIGSCVQMNLPKRKYAEMELILQGENYDKINCSRLNRPKFTDTADLEAEILSGPGSNFDYLLDLSDRKKSEESLLNYGEKLVKLEQELADLIRISSLGRFAGAAIWESELDQLEEAIREGQRTRWYYEDAAKYKFE